MPLAAESEPVLGDPTPVGADHVVSVRDLTHVITDHVVPERNLDAVLATVVVVAMVVAAVVGEGAANAGVWEAEAERTESAVERRRQGAHDADGGDRVLDFLDGEECRLVVVLRRDGEGSRLGDGDVI